MRHRSEKAPEEHGAEHERQEDARRAARPLGRRGNQPRKPVTQE